MTDEAIRVDRPTRTEPALVATETVSSRAGVRPERSMAPGRASDSTARFEHFCVEEHAAMANALGWALGNHDLGREATDEAFARAYERWSSVSAMDNPAGWVYRVGLNWGRRRIWRKNKERQLLASVELDDQMATVNHDTLIDHDLADALGALPLKFRAVIVLRHLLGYSERDTAEALGISTGTAKSRMSRGLVRLRAELEQSGHTGVTSNGTGRPALFGDNRG